MSQLFLEWLHRGRLPGFLGLDLAIALFHTFLKRASMASDFAFLLQTLKKQYLFGRARKAKVDALV